MSGQPATAPFDPEYRQINEMVWEVWERGELLCYQLHGPHGEIYLMGPELLEELLKRAG